MSDVGARAQSILEHLAGQRDAMVEMLVSLANKESPTDVAASQAAVQSQLSDAECATCRVVRRVGTCSRCRRSDGVEDRRSCSWGTRIPYGP